MITFKIRATGIGETRRYLAGVRARASDLREPFGDIVQDFLETNEATSFRESPGRYQDLSPFTKRRKLARFGRFYPVLVGTGRLRDSLTGDGSSETVKVIKKDSVTVGTTVPYGYRHQLGVGVPRRQFLLGDLDNRLPRWTNMIGEFIAKG